MGEPAKASQQNPSQDGSDLGAQPQAGNGRGDPKHTVTYLIEVV